MKLLNMNTKKFIPWFLFCLTLIVNINVVNAQQFISSSNKFIDYEGRTIDTANAKLLSWPGTSVTIRFKGNFLNATLMDTDTSDYFNIILDKKVYNRIHIENFKKEYTLVDKLPNGTHTVELFKLTESTDGNCLFFGFTSNVQAELLKPLRKAKRIEFYSNSITCGYGVEDTVQDRGTGFYKNNYLSYAALTARKFNAHYACIAKSGIGVTVSWFPLVMPEMYDRSTENNAFRKWDFKKWAPEIVVINLFQNDAWITNMPEYPEYIHRFKGMQLSDSFFISQYKNFVSEIRAKYPFAKIICSIGSMDASKKGSKWVTYIKEAIKQKSDPKIFLLVYPYKQTPGHPKVKEQKKMANLLISFISKHQLWK